jgi:transcriptional regulator with XRE-family HTH domain
MAKQHQMATVGETFARQTRETRERLMLTQRDLAERLTALGMRADQTTVAKIESGSRRVTIEDALLIAAALDVAPLHLLIPREDDAALTIGRLSGSADSMRRWAVGDEPLSDSDGAVYFAEAPADSAAAMTPGAWHLLVTAHALARAARADEPTETLALAEDLIREAERQRDAARAKMRRSRRGG